MSDIYIEIDQAQLDRFTNGLEDGAEDAINEALDDILVATELVQAASYLRTSNPGLPAGSTYRRTFRLRESSRTKRGSRKLPQITGSWFTDPGVAPYADEVIGPRSEQKPIHRGRWKSLEDIQAKIDELAPAIMEEKLDAISI